MAKRDLAQCDERAVKATKKKRGERGVVTAEYAAMMVAGVSFVGIIIKVLTDPRVQELLLQLLQLIFKWIFSLIGH